MSKAQQKKIEDVDVENDESAREVLSVRIPIALIERLRNIAEHLPKTSPGTTASMATVVESILDGRTTLTQLEKRIVE